MNERTKCGTDLRIGDRSRKSRGPSLWDEFDTGALSPRVNFILFCLSLTLGIAAFFYFGSVG